MKGTTKKASPRDVENEAAPAGFGTTIHSLLKETETIYSDKDQITMGPLEYIALKAQLLAARIENERLLEMQKQTKVLEEIADHLSNISGSAQALEPLRRNF